VASRSPSEYDRLGRQAVLALLEVEHAAAIMEIEAKISDVAHPSVGTPVEPIHLTNALRSLQKDGLIAVRSDKSRGSRDIPIAHLAGRRNATAVERASARKRLLMSRYLGWAQGTPTRKAIIGPAAERALHEALVRASGHGYRLAKPDGGDVTEFLGDPVPIGSLDNAAIFTPLVGGLPGESVALPMEVKNVRDWIHPSNAELYQLLAKAALIARAHPEVPLTPVFVCRRAHATTFRMAKDLGFFVIQTHRQYISQAAAEAKLVEIRRELGFLDLARQEGPDPVILRRLVRTLPQVAAGFAERWAVTARDDSLPTAFGLMRTLGTARGRSRLFRDLRLAAQVADLYETAGW
jgi:hypothetical protein